MQKFPLELATLALCCFSINLIIVYKSLFRWCPLHFS